MSEEDQTVEAIRDDLDNYGGHLRVLIETSQGNLYQVGDIRTYDFGDGPEVVIETGDRDRRRTS